MENEFFVSTDQSKLDIQAIHRFLSQESYWARGRSLSTVENSIRHSLCFGAYHVSGQQAGFARVVSDFAVFAWIMDVFVFPVFRGRGVGKLLVETIVQRPDLQSLQRWGLATRDAHSLYEQYGFKKIAEPEILMEIVNKPR